MTRRAIVCELAENDLRQEAIYIATNNLDAAIRFLAAAEETFQKLANMPIIGRLTTFANPNLGELRQWRIEGFKNYLIFYRVTDTTVDVIRVLHGARDIPAILSETDEDDESL